VVSAAAVGQGCTNEAPKPSAEPPIVIGVSLGLTGDLGSFSAPFRDAVRCAEGELNAGGGLLGRPVRFDIVDDRSDEKDYVLRVSDDFVRQNVAAVIGPVSSGQVKLTQGILGAAQIIQIVPSATSLELTDVQPASDRFLFRTTPADDYQGAAVMLLASKTPQGLGSASPPANPCTKLALVYIDNAYGTSMAKVIRDNFPKRGVANEIVADELIPLEVKSDYGAEVSRIMATDPQCLAIISYDKAAAQFITDFKKDAAKFESFKQKGFFFIGTDGIFTQGFLDSSRADPSDVKSPSTAEGVFGTNPDTQPGTAEYNAFRTLFGTYFPLGNAKDAPSFAANTFDAAILIAFAIQKAGSSTDRVALRDALKEVSRPGGRPISPSEINDGLAELRLGNDIDYKGASGSVDFADNGNVPGGFIVWEAARDNDSGAVVYRTAARFSIEELAEQLK